MTTPIEKFQKNIGIHSLDLLNENSVAVATISSVTDSAYLQFYTNIDTSNYISQGSSNGLYFIRERYNSNGFIYTSNTVLVNNIESYNILTDSISHNTSFLIYPNASTSISSYRFLASSSVGFNYSSNIFTSSVCCYFFFQK